MPWLLIFFLLAGCATTPLPPPAPTCPDPVRVPAPLRKGESVGTLEIRVELARLAERARGDACAADAAGLREWMRK